MEWISLAEIASLATSFAGCWRHGELAGLLIVKAYHKFNGETVGGGGSYLIHFWCQSTARKWQALRWFLDQRGGVDVAALREMVGPQTAGLMLTNPNTLGLFDENLEEIAAIIHDAGGLLYYDGANANAILGITRPGDTGFDIVHFNLHKTFSTPHGGGGPGAGPIVVSEKLVDFLPSPIVEYSDGRYHFATPKHSIGPIKAFYGNFGVLVKAYSDIRRLGAEGLKSVSENAVLNANYVMNQLKDDYYLPRTPACMSLSSQAFPEGIGVSTLDVKHPWIMGCI